MLSRGVRVAVVRGVEVRLDASLVLLAVLLSWLLYGRFALVHEPPVAAAMALGACLLFLVSILAHELAHALEALHRGIEVHAITLLLFGGVTEMHSESRRPRDEFVVAAVGPYISLVCAAAFGVVAAGAERALPVALAVPVIDVARLLALVNVLLAVFNLVPGAPLDGGRVLRAALWWLLGDRRRAVRVAARAGMAFGGLLAAGGVWLFARDQALLVTGLWWVVIGVFLFTAARGELRHGHVQGLLDGRRVADVLDPDPRRVPVGHRLETLPLDTAGDVVLVTDDDGAVVGWLEPDQLAAMHPADRALRTTGDVMHPVAEAPPIDRDEELRVLVDRFVQGDHDRLRVEADGIPVAVLSEARTARALEAFRRARR